ncbi:hypothetical protein FI667_g7022, partial [Globisporangium splendens]
MQTYTEPYHDAGGIMRNRKALVCELASVQGSTRTTTLSVVCYIASLDPSSSNDAVHDIVLIAQHLGLVRDVGHFSLAECDEIGACSRAHAMKELDLHTRQRDAVHVKDEVHELVSRELPRSKQRLFRTRVRFCLQRFLGELPLLCRVENASTPAKGSDRENIVPGKLRFLDDEVQQLVFAVDVLVAVDEDKRMRRLLQLAAFVSWNDVFMDVEELEVLALDQAMEARQKLHLLHGKLVEDQATPLVLDVAEHPDELANDGTHALLLL